MAQGESTLTHAASSPRGLERRTVLVALGSVGLGLLALCARYDLPLSVAWVDRHAAWARFAERYGELPGFYAVALAFLATLLRATPRARFERAGLCLVTALGVTLAFAVSYYRAADAIPTLALFCATLSAVFALLCLIQSHVDARWTELAGLRRAARTTLWLALGSALFVHPLKLVWGRVRFRDLDVAHSAFSAWYLPQGPTGHASFPSGHAAMAWMLLPALLLFGRRTLARSVTTAVVIGWGGFVALGRVVIGAHYASDVLASTLFALAVVAWASQRSDAPTDAR